MRSFLASVAGIGMLACILLAIVQSNFLWVLGALGIAGILTLFELDQPRMPNKAHDEDLSAKETNRSVAVRLAAEPGLIGIQARQWLKAYEADSTVPIYGVRPYWTPTGPGGTPQMLSTIGLRGLEDRLAYARDADADDALLSIMAADPHRRVREATRARIGIARDR